MFPSAAPPPSRPRRKKIFVGEKPPSLFARLLPWLFIILAVAIITAMIVQNPPQKKLVCQNTRGGNSLTDMGTCLEQ